MGLQGTSLKFDVTIVAVDHIYDAEMDSDFNLDRKLITFVAITQMFVVQEIL
jgi:hypothetical protein